MQEQEQEQALEVCTITIPAPSYIPRARGIHAVGKFGTVLKAKCTKEEYDTVQEAAATLGITKSEFIRWCAYHVARKILGGSDGKGTEHDTGSS